MNLFNTIKLVVMAVNAIVGTYWMVLDAVKKYNKQKDRYNYKVA